jgi:hypothetical protein
MDRMSVEMGLRFRLSNFVTTQFHDLEFYVALEKGEASTNWKHEAEKAREGALWPHAMPAQHIESALV